MVGDRHRTGKGADLRPAQDQPYSGQGRPAWEEPHSEKTVRYDQAAFQKDPLNAPMPQQVQPGRRDEPIDPTAIYAPDRTSPAKPEESDGRDQAGPGADQGTPWYGSDR